MASPPSSSLPRPLSSYHPAFATTPGLSHPPRRSGSVKHNRPKDLALRPHTRPSHSEGPVSAASVAAPLDWASIRHTRRSSIPNVATLVSAVKDHDLQSPKPFQFTQASSSMDKLAMVVKESGEEGEGEGKLDTEASILDEEEVLSDSGRQRRLTNASSASASSGGKTSLLSSSIMEETEPDFMTHIQYSTSSILSTPSTSSSSLRNPKPTSISSFSYRPSSASSTAFEPSTPAITSTATVPDPQSPESLAYKSPTDHRNSQLTVQPNESRTDIEWNDDAESCLIAEQEPPRLREGSTDGGKSWMTGLEDSGSGSVGKDADSITNSIAHSLTSIQSQPSPYNSRQVGREKIYNPTSQAILDTLGDAHNMSPTEQQYRRIINEYQALQSIFKRTKDQIDKKLTTDEKIALGNAINKMCDYRAYKVNWEAYNRKEIRKYQLEAHMEFPDKLSKADSFINFSGSPSPSGGGGGGSSSGSGSIGKKLFRFGARKN